MKLLQMSFTNRYKIFLKKISNKSFHFCEVKALKVLERKAVSSNHICGMMTRAHLQFTLDARSFKFCTHSLDLTRSCRPPLTGHRKSETAGDRVATSVDMFVCNLITIIDQGSPCLEANRTDIS